MDVQQSSSSFAASGSMASITFFARHSIKICSNILFEVRWFDHDLDGCIIVFKFYPACYLHDVKWAIRSSYLHVAVSQISRFCIILSFKPWEPNNWNVKFLTCLWDSLLWLNKLFFPRRRVTLSATPITEFDFGISMFTSISKINLSEKEVHVWF